MRLVYVCLLAAVALRAEGGGTIEGVVRHAVTGKPLPKARVIVHAARGQYWAQSRSSILTDEKGRFVVSRVDPVQYFVGAEKEGFVPLFYGSPAPQVNGVLVAVRDGEKTPQLELRLTPAGVNQRQSHR